MDGRTIDSIPYQPILTSGFEPEFVGEAKFLRRNAHPARDAAISMMHSGCTAFCEPEFFQTNIIEKMYNCLS